MREKTIEQHLVKAVKNSGGIAPKLVSPGFDGMPDRLVLLPGGKIGFVEVKAPGKEPRPLQVARHGLLPKGMPSTTSRTIPSLPCCLTWVSARRASP